MAETRDKFVDRKRLSGATKLLNEATIENPIFMCGKQVPDILLTTITVEELGDIQIPVTLKDVEKLRMMSNVVPYGKGMNIFYDPSITKAWHVDPLKILSKPDWSSLIVPHLGLPTLSIDVEAKLVQLTLYETGGHYTQALSPQTEFGTIGTAILQLPVEGGHEGGRLSVQYKGKKKMFETQSNSEQLFYLAAFYGNCKQLMEPTTRGWKIALTFSLVWKNANTDTPRDIPNFLTALKEVEEALSPWIISHERSLCLVEKDAMEIEERTTPSDQQRAQILPPKIASDRSHDAEEEEESDCSDDYDCMDGDTLNEDALFFVLKEKYKVENLTFNRLRGKDRSLAKLLQKCHFLDVHLAMVILESTNKKQNGSREEEVTTHISRWVDSSNTIRKLSLKLDWQKQRVGPIRKLLTSSGVEHDREKLIYDEESDKEDEGDSDFDEEDETEENSEEEDECSDEESLEESDDNEEQEAENAEDQVEEEDEEAVFRKRKEKLLEGRNLLRRLISEERAKQKEDDIISCSRYFYHFVLVIWPKHQSFRMYCRYGINSLLDDMENALSSSSSIQTEKIRHELIGDLKKMISFCCAEPQRAWSEENLQDKGKGDLTLRLLRLCIALRAREEGLALLNILGSNFGTDGVDCTAESFEGIQNEYVARAIADFECEVVGWNDCADLIQRIISCDRVLKQLVPLTKLAHYFVDVNCFDGAKTVGDCISSSFNKFDLLQAEKLASEDIKLYLNFLVSLESETKTSNRERLTSFVSLFPKLLPEVQCHLILDLEAQGKLCFNGIDSCQFMFPELCKVFLSCNLHSQTQPVKNVVVDLLLCFVRLGNVEWLRSLIGNICRVVPSNTQTIEGTISFSNELVQTLVSSAAFWELATLSEQSADFSGWYRDTCSFFVNQDFVSPLKSLEDVAVTMFKSLFLLNDEQIWQSFARQICNSFDPDTSNVFVLNFVKNTEIQKSLCNSHLAFSAFELIVDHWIEQWKSLKEPQFSWQQHKAVLPDHPEVETFLRSPQWFMTYAKFTKAAEVRRFAQQLDEMESFGHFSVTVTRKGKGKTSRCDIAKDRRYFDRVLNSFQTRKSELDSLVKLRDIQSQLCKEQQQN